jgi:hypothetical protein
MKADMRVVRLPQASLRELYEAPLALIRPDQIVAWRGTSADDAMRVLAQVTGRVQSVRIDSTTPA